MPKLSRSFDLNCGYTIFSVKEGKTLEDLGETDFDLHKVTIRHGLEDKVYLEVLWHEILHIVLELSGYGGHPEEEDTLAILPPTTNEELATRLSRSFLMVLKLNSFLKEYI